MLSADGFWPSFKPVDDERGYLPLEDHCLIGDDVTAAMVGLDGAIPWLCLPRSDSPPVFCSTLDRRRGGRFVVAPDGLVEARQRHEPDRGVLVTEMRTPTGLVRVIDALALRRGADLTEDATRGAGRASPRGHGPGGRLGGCPTPGGKLPEAETLVRDHRRPEPHPPEPATTR